MLTFLFPAFFLVSSIASAANVGPWQVLFDGRNTDAWRGFRQSSFPSQGWIVQNGSLCHVAQVNAGDLITKKEYGSFELVLDWAITEGGNSGVLYRVSEAGQMSWETGAEMQILDDLHHPDGRNPLTSAGSLYGLIGAQGKTLAPVGQFNRARLLVIGNHVEHWLNGRKLVEYEFGSPAWESLVASSKFKDLPNYGRNPVGHIALQDHWDGACFRNIMIREIR